MNIAGRVRDWRTLAFGVVLPALLFAPFPGTTFVEAQSTGSVTAPTVEIVEDEPEGFAGFTDYLVEFQRHANAEVATHMNAIRSGDDLGAFFLGLAVAFAYGVVHALGPGHGKFIIVSYFLGREVRIARGFIMATQVAIVHVISAIVIVWLADTVLKAGFGIGLSDIPGVRAGSFLIIAGIGIYMLYQAIRASFGSSPGTGADHNHNHSHGHGHGHSHGHSHGGSIEGGILAFAAGVVPCPGAVLIMLYAVANDMIYPGFILVVAMSLGIGLTICSLGVGAILARQSALRLVDSATGHGGVVVVRHALNYTGAVFVTLIGLFSFVAFLDVPSG